MANNLNGQNIKGRLDIFEASATYTRPLNTTAYAADDAVSDSSAVSAASNLVFAAAASENGGSIRLDYASITSDQATTAPSLDLWLYDTAPTVQADNAAFTLSDSENDDVQAIISVISSFSTNNNWRLERRSLNTIINLGANTTNLFGQLKIGGAYTPTSGEVFNIILRGTYL